jgi:guanylate kinase
MSGRILIVAGISGSGKGTVCDKLIERHPGKLVRVISVTTRTPRPGDRFADHYFFVSKELFEWLIETGQLLEYTTVWVNHYYGSLLLSVEQSLAQGKDVLFEVNIEGIDAIKERYPDTKVVYIKAPSESEQRLRLELRGTVGEEQDERVKGAATELAKAEARSIPIIVNDDLAVTLKEVEKVLELVA